LKQHTKVLLLSELCKKNQKKEQFFCRFLPKTCLFQFFFVSLQSKLNNINEKKRQK